MSRHSVRYVPALGGACYIDPQLLSPLTSRCRPPPHLRAPAMAYGWPQFGRLVITASPFRSATLRNTAESWNSAANVQLRHPTPRGEGPMTRMTRNMMLLSAAMLSVTVAMPCGHAFSAEGMQL